MEPRDPQGARIAAWAALVCALALVALLVWRAAFAGLGCFDAPPGECDPPDDAFDGIDTFIALAAFAFTCSVLGWVWLRFGGRQGGDRPS